MNEFIKKHLKKIIVVILGLFTLTAAAATVLMVPQGGTGLNSVTSGSYLKGAGTAALVARTPTEVRTDLGLGTGNSPTFTGLTLIGGNFTHSRNGTSQWQFTAFDNANNYPLIDLRKARGVIGTPTTVASGDILYEIYGTGYDGTQYTQSSVIRSVVSGAVSSNVLPVDLVFLTTTTNYTGWIERMRITSDGNVGIGTTTFGANAATVLGLANGTAPAAAVANTIQIYSADTADATATLGLMLEQAVEAVGTFTASQKIKVIINGTAYWIQLDPV